MRVARVVSATVAVAGLVVLFLSLPGPPTILAYVGLGLAAVAVIASVPAAGGWSTRMSAVAVAAVAFLLAFIPFEVAGWMDLVRLASGSCAILVHWFTARFTDQSDLPWTPDAVRFGLSRIVAVGALAVVVTVVVVGLPWATASLWGPRWGASADARSLAASGLVVGGALLVVAARSILRGSTGVEADDGGRRDTQ